MTYTHYEVYTGDRPLAVREAPTAYAALLDYVRSIGCHDRELMRLSDDALSWRGAIFRARPVPVASSASEPRSA